MRAHYVNTTENQEFLFNVLSLMHSPIMYWQSKDAQQLFFIVLPPCDGNTNSFLTQEEILLDLTDLSKNLFGHFSAHPMGSPKWHIIEFRNDVLARKEPK